MLFSNMFLCDSGHIIVHNCMAHPKGALWACDSGHIIVHNCMAHPKGALWVCDTVKLCIYPSFSDSQYCQMKQEADRALHNYRQDCLISNHYGISYEQYITNIIDVLIAGQDSVDRQADTDSHIYQDQPDTDINNVHYACHNIEPPNMRVKRQVSELVDINYPDKVRGYIALQSTDFSFIGPDRQAIDTYDLDTYLRVAGTVKQSGVPNYRLVRIPIAS